MTGWCWVLFTKLGEHLDFEMIDMLIPRQVRVDEPGRDGVAISSRCFAEPQLLSDLSAMQLDRVAFPVVLLEQGRIQFQLVGNVVHDGSGNLIFCTGKAPFQLKALEQEGTAQARRTGLIGENLQVIL